MNREYHRQKPIIETSTTCRNTPQRHSDNSHHGHADLASNSPIHLHLDTLHIIHPRGKPALPPHSHHIPQPQLPHKHAVARALAAALLSQREDARLVVDSVRPAPHDAVLPYLVRRRPVALDEKALGGVQLVVEEGLGRCHGRLLRAEVVELEGGGGVVRGGGGLPAPALDAGFEPGPRVVVGAVVGVRAAPALVVAAGGEDNFAAWVGEDGRADEGLEGFRGEGLARGAGVWGVGEDGGGLEVSGGLGWPAGEAEGWGAELSGNGLEEGCCGEGGVDSLGVRPQCAG
jgi:hypothetical protein